MIKKLVVAAIVVGGLGLAPVTAASAAPAHSRHMHHAACTIYVVPIQDQTNTLGTPITNGLQVFVQASNGALSAFRYAAYGLPAGLSIGRTSGLITGLLTRRGVYPATVTVEAPGDCRGERSFTWTVI